MHAIYKSGEAACFYFYVTRRLPHWARSPRRQYPKQEKKITENGLQDGDVHTYIKIIRIRRLLS